jgi:UMF1 family MFS transporter
LRSLRARSAAYRNIVTFLLARGLFYEGFISLMLFTGVFAAGILRWTPTMFIVQGLANSVAATTAGFFAGWLDTRIGSKGATISSSPDASSPTSCSRP